MKIPCTPNASALYALGVCYENGDGVPVDTDKALDYLKRAADMGSADAQCELGYYYFDSEENYGKALEWFQKAADLGIPTDSIWWGSATSKAMTAKRTRSPWTGSKKRRITGMMRRSI